MKKIRTTIFALLLSSLLAGNIFAAAVILPSGGAVPNILSYVVEGVLTLLRDGDCPPRQCTDCRPNGELDEGGNCRPPA